MEKSNRRSFLRQALVVGTLLPVITTMGFDEGAMHWN